MPLTCVQYIHIHVRVEKKNEYSKNKQGDFSKKNTLTGVNLLKKNIPERCCFP